MKHGHHRLSDLLEKFDYVPSVIPTKNAKFVLHANHVDAREIRVLRRQTIIAKLALSDFEYDFGRIVIATRGIAYRDDAGFDVIA